MQCALSGLHRYRLGLLGLVGELQEAMLAHDIRKEHEPTLSRREYFAYQDETQ
jgi:hypothetical protein